MQGCKLKCYIAPTMFYNISPRPNVIKTRTHMSTTAVSTENKIHVHHVHVTCNWGSLEERERGHKTLDDSRVWDQKIYVQFKM